MTDPRSRITIVCLAAPRMLREMEQQRFRIFHGRHFPHVELYPHPLDRDASTIEDLRVVPRLNKALALVDTPYVAVVGDDDFLSPLFVDKAIAILDREPTVVAVDGDLLRFREGFDGFRVSRPLVSPTSKQHSLEKSRDAYVRLRKEGRAFNPQVLGAVARTSAQRSAWAPLHDVPLFWTDNFAVLGLLLNGEIRRLALVSQVRSIGARMVSEPLDKTSIDSMTKADLLNPIHAELVQEILQRYSSKLWTLDVGKEFIRASAQQCLRGSSMSGRLRLRLMRLMQRVPGVGQGDSALEFSRSFVGREIQDLVLRYPGRAVRQAR